MLGELIGLMALTIILATLCCFNIINPGAEDSRKIARVVFSILIVLVSVVICSIVFYLQNNYSINI